MQITVFDPILQRDVTFPVDYLTLASAIVSHRDQELAQMFKVPLDEDGWFFEAHQKLRPVDFATDGVFMAGLAHYPKPMEETIAAGAGRGVPGRDFADLAETPGGRRRGRSVRGALRRLRRVRHGLSLPGH